MAQDARQNNCVGNGIHPMLAYDQLLRNLTDHLPITLYQFVKYPDGTSQFLYVSKAVSEIFEVNPEELLNDAETLNKRVHQEDVGRLNESIIQSVENMQIWDCQFRVVLPDKGMRWIRGVARPEKLDDTGVISTGYWEDITEQKRNSDWISYLNTALMNISESIIITNTESRIIYANQRVKEFHGYEIDEILGKPADMMRVVPMSEDEQVAMAQAFDEDRTYVGTELSQRKDGSTFLCEFSLTPIYGDDQATCIGIQRDITERTCMVEALAESNERYKATLLSVGEGIISTDCDGKITVMNPLAERMTGWPQQEAVGKPLTQILSVMDEQTGKVIVNPADVVLETAATYQPDFPTILFSKSCTEIPVKVIAAPIKNSNGETSGVVIVFQDFSEYRERQKQIEYLSYRDYLTGLYNRRFLEKAISDVDIRANLPLTVMSIDVNGLKLTNDAFGHAMGDRLLRTVADILRSACRSTDIIARNGGDEFAILLPQTDTATAKKIKQRILQTAMNTKLDTVIVSLAVGYSVKTNMSDNINNAFMTADKLMYKEKFKQGQPTR